MALRFTA
ncbi:hypothetical protein GQ607_007126 [Colletotrichum asianum]|nr:hypothetical protein GQ607_007126 [Colletotrichum asianum]